MAKHDADIWMPIDIGKYLGDTMHLTTVQHGAYFLLLMDYWKRGALQNNEPQIAAICRMDATSIAWADAWAVLKSYFVAGADGLLHNHKADKEIAKALYNRCISAEKAKKAADARWLKTSSKDAPSITQAMLKECASPSPLPKEKNRAQKSSTFPEGYQPKESHKELAASLGINLRESFPAFRDFHTSKGNTFKDWDAALRTWLRNERKFSKTPPANQAAPPNAMDKFKANVERLKGAN